MTLLLRAPEAGKRAVVTAEIVNVGEVVEDDDIGDVEQVSFAPEHVLADCRAVSPQQVAHAVKCLARQGLVVAFETEKLGCRAVVAQPAATLALAGGVRHPRNDQRLGDARVAALDPEAMEGIGEAEIVEGCKAQPLAARHARVLVVERVEVDGRDVVFAVRGFGRVAVQPLGPELGHDVLGCGADLGRGLEQRQLAVEHCLDEVGDILPVLAGHRIVGAEVEQCLLFDLVPGSFGSHEAIAVGGFAVGAVCFGCSDVHAWFRVGGGCMQDCLFGPPVQALNAHRWHYTRPSINIWYLPEPVTRYIVILRWPAHQKNIAGCKKVPTSDFLTSWRRRFERRALELLGICCVSGVRGRFFGCHCSHGRVF